MTTAEAIYRAFMAATHHPTKPMDELPVHFRLLYEIRAHAFETTYRDYPLPERLFRAFWDGMWVVPWSASDPWVRSLWTTVAAEFAAIDRSEAA
jgi:hypothetical protein